jgi:biopolymer transport protein ExbB
MHSVFHRHPYLKLALSLFLIALAVCYVSSTWAQEAAAPAAGEEAAAEGEGAHAPKTAMGMIWEVAKTPPYVFFLLVICSIVTLTLIIERFLFYRKASGQTLEQLDKVKQAATISDALTAVQDAPGVSGRIIRMALTSTRDGYKPEEVERLVEGEVTKELIQMEKYLPQLDSMVTLCPLMGLLGTTVGMIKSFSIVAAIGMSDPTKLAGGISEALINTATGLAIAIPALFAYNWFTGKKEAILMDMEKGLSELMVILKSSHEG